MVDTVECRSVFETNLKSAVAQVLGLSRARVETDRWIAFRSHFNIESFYCRPGIEGAHEKGGGEGMIGYFRRNHFTPVPEVDSLAELNEMVDQWDLHDGHRRIGSRPRTVDEYFAVEQPLLLPLPEEPFETGRLFTPRVDRYSQINVRTNRFSVPTRLIGKRVRVVLHASHLVVYERNIEVARHERLIEKGGCRLDLDHYLEALIRKPGAFPGATALEQARSAGKFTPMLFQVLTEREEKISVAIASNESFGGWTKTFTDPRLCAAIVDRLTFNGTIIETGTDSYRLASTRARAEEHVAS